MTPSPPADKPAGDPSDLQDGLDPDGPEAALAAGDAAQAEGPAPEDAARATSAGDAAANGDDSSATADESPEDASASPSQTKIEAERDREPAGAAPSVSALQAELDRAQDHRIRLAADFDNYRKRTEGQLRSRWNHAQADLLARLLDPLDDLSRVTGCDPETATAESLVEGVAQVERKFARILEDAGVEVVDPLGKPFDPNRMEAMMRVPADSEELDEVVQLVVQRGFTHKGQLLRPARVAVYKAE